MAFQNNPVQPGVLLNEVIVGAFRASGISFGEWCRRNSISPSTAAGAIYGQSGGVRGKALLNRIIDDAGRDLVLAAYRKRIDMEHKRLQSLHSDQAGAAA